MSTAPLVDTRKDSTGQTISYKTVELKDGNIWLAENLNYYAHSDQWTGCQGWDWPGESMEYRKNGCYYQWDTLMKQSIPAGWHVPTVDEWKTLIDCYGGLDQAYDVLVKGGSSGLDLTIGGGSYFTKTSVTQLLDLGFFWTSSEGDEKEFSALIQLTEPDKKVEVVYLRKSCLFSARLIKDK